MFVCACGGVSECMCVLPGVGREAPQHVCKCVYVCKRVCGCYLALGVRLRSTCVSVCMCVRECVGVTWRWA